MRLTITFLSPFLTTLFFQSQRNIKPPPGKESDKKNDALIKPLQPDIINDRMDVDKVTLEEDEKGDQNLDEDATMNGNGEEPLNRHDADEDGLQEHMVDN